VSRAGRLQVESCQSAPRRPADLRFSLSLYGAPLLGGLLLDRLVRLPDLPRRLRLPAGLAALLGGAALTGWFLGTMRAAGTPVDVRHAPTRPVVEGPFRLTRNPGYVALALVYAGVSLLANGRWPQVLLPGVLAAVDRGVIVREERYLERRFGPDYDSYRRRVGRWVRTLGAG
jgi:protein-S-isoprenylcysteine O-methyltransferase Ste14